LGAGSVKLLVGEGSARLERALHAGAEAWDPADAGDDAGRAAAALMRLLKRLNLNRKRLGRIAAGTNGIGSSVREILLPALTEAELRRALPFEARKHLFLEGMSEPVLDCQILGDGPPAEEGGTPQIRVLLAAVPAESRAFPLTVLQLAGLEPEVVDLEPLANLNAAFAEKKPAAGGALGVLDLGARQAAIYLSTREGGFLSRPVGPGVPAGDDGESVATYADELVERLRETATFYRGRHRLEIDRILISGGGALVPGLVDRLRGGYERPMEAFDPLQSLLKSNSGMAELVGHGPRFTTACGLCRWWDHAEV
jgi:Tfp pilus assembly PilM family ATPase